MSAYQSALMDAWASYCLDHPVRTFGRSWPTAAFSRAFWAGMVHGESK